MSSAGPYRDEVVVRKITRTPSNFGVTETSGASDPAGPFACHVGPPSVSVDKSQGGQSSTVTRVVRFRGSPPVSFSDTELVWNGRVLKPILPAAIATGRYRDRGLEIACTDVTDKRGV